MQATVEQTNYLDNLPDEMKNLKRWLLWKGEIRYDKEGNPQKDSRGNIKIDKVPKQANGYNASKTNPDHHITFNEAMKAYNTGNFSGVGFCLVENDPYVIIDVDDCFTGSGGLTDKANKIVDAADSFTEISQSGNGLHIVVRAENIEGFNNQAESVEMYSKEWFFAMTGNVLRDDLDTIENKNEFVSYLHDTFSTKIEKQPEPIEDQPETHGDDEIISKARNAKNGEKFSALYDNGDVNTWHNGDDSAADMALANMLAWWTPNANQIEHIMRKSALYREKWDKHPDYLRGIGYTIDTALKNRQNAVSDFQISFRDSDTFDLQKVLKSRRFEELEAMENKWLEDGKNGKKPTTISPVRCAVVLMEYINFAMFDLEENTRVAMYLPNDGIYTRNTTMIKRYISWLEPKHNSYKADEVIYHLTNMAEVKEKTESRYLIPVGNGIFNLKTKKLEPFSPEYVFTSKISTNYIDNPEKPIINGWDIDKWLDSIACHDEEIVHLLWQVINDSLNGNYSRKKALFLVGEGNNGKGTFQELIANLIGPKNIASLKVNEFDERFKISLLEGKTTVIGDDVPAGVYIEDSSNFNSVITGDPVLVEQKHKPAYRATFKCSVIQSTNGMPKFKNKTNGTIRRLVIVPFRADFNGTTEKPDIKEKYICDENVLQYVLHKAINMDFEKFDIPAASKKELEIFKQDNDPVLDFKVSVFDEWDIQKVPKYVVYEFYKRFCNDNGYKFLSNVQFHKQFRTYLGSNWNPDSSGRFRYTDLNNLGDLDLLGIFFPDESKKQRSYENMNFKQ